MDTHHHLKIGSSPDLDIVLSHPTISREHLAVYLDGDQLLLEDLNSKNGTYINGRRIQKSPLAKKDNLRLGDYLMNVEDLFNRAIMKLSRDRQDFHEEFERLRNSFRQYEAVKKRVIDGPLIPFILRIGATLAIIAVLLFYPSLIPDQNLRYSLILVVGMLAMAMQRIGGTQAGKLKRLERLNLEFEDILVCPKCGQSLTGKSLHYWESKGRCSGKNCDALFVKRS